MTTARDLMTKSPVAIDATATVQTASEQLQALDIRHLPVVDTDGGLIGMISDRDLRAFAMPYFLDGEYQGTLRTALDTAVAAIMTGDVIAVDVDTPAGEIIDVLLEYKIGAVPVVDANQTLVGMVSYINLLKRMRRDER